MNLTPLQEKLGGRDVVRLINSFANNPYGLELGVLDLADELQELGADPLQVMTDAIFRLRHREKLAKLACRYETLYSLLIKLTDNGVTKWWLDNLGDEMKITMETIIHPTLTKVLKAFVDELGKFGVTEIYLRSISRVEFDFHASSDLRYWLFETLVFLDSRDRGGQYNSNYLDSWRDIP